MVEVPVAVRLILMLMVEEWAEGAVQRMRVLMMAMVMAMAEMAMAEMAANRIGLGWVEALCGVVCNQGMDSKGYLLK